MVDPGSQNLWILFRPNLSKFTAEPMASSLANWLLCWKDGFRQMFPGFTIQTLD